MSARDRLAERLRAEGGLVGAAVARPVPPAAEPAAEPHRALAAVAAREGYDLHHGGGRIVRTEDPDLALLAGDRLYALGLAELAAAGDLDGVGLLAAVIAGSAAARAAGDEACAERLWERLEVDLARPATSPAHGEQ